MEPFVERMVKEYDELNDRVNKLGVIYRMALANRLKRQGVDTSADAI